MNVSTLPSKEWLDELFEYIPESGLFWRLRPIAHFRSEVDWYIWNKRFAKKPAGTRKMKTRNGISKRDHCRVQLPMSITGELKSFSVHRIAFAMMGAEVPDGKIIDHIDEDPWNNRWDNLRVATHSQNGHNHSGWRRRKHDLPKGVYFDPRRRNPYYAMLKVGDKYERIINRPTVELALQDYLRKAEEVHQEFLAVKRGRNYDLRLTQ